MKKVLATSLLVFLVGYAIFQAINPTNAKVGITEGNVPPDFELMTLDGEKMSLSSLEGKKVILNFWATWCPPCREEMPDMQKIHDEYEGEVVVAAVNLTSSEKNSASVKHFVDELGLSFPVLLDEDGKINKQFEVLSYPTSYIVNKDGVITTKFVGAMTYEQMQDFIAD
ncbi:TlpA family protein disulfide reductase [Metabacillus litoralis]|uniref:TlpA family protein disulfide reductase n=1 Tax=Metabacillus litoralis TaxID=152268 RepID=UPI0020416CC1|nr:TlpA disulfide reductase family protein [Metabacillus litoralis]MCM3653618.1 TlpA family protein disulfide reductase [Metabacillus litoralis]